RIIRMYGQTESSMCCYAERRSPPRCMNGRISVGSPFGGMEMFVLDDAGAEVNQVGQSGELWIRGPALFSGYFEDPQTTAERLPYDPRYPSSGDRAFRSGDLVFVDDRGDYYFFARKDTQVKVSGNRVELEEVEAIVEQHVCVQRAVAAVEKTESGDELVLFLVTDTPC